MHPVIQIEKLCKHYMLGKESIPVLQDISFAVNEGEYLAIMGQSGAGKSTLLNILGCLDTPSSGSFLLNNWVISDLKQSQLADIRNKYIGFVFQNFNLLPKLDVESNVELALIYGNVPKRERKKRVQEVLEKLGLWDRRRHKPNEISGGQKQRVAIARAIVKKPALILADEPTGNLDSNTATEILDMFHQLNQQGNTIILITHDIGVAQRANRKIKLVDGRVE